MLPRRTSTDLKGGSGGSTDQLIQSLQQTIDQLKQENTSLKLSKARQGGIYEDDDDDDENSHREMVQMQISSLKDMINEKQQEVQLLQDQLSQMQIQMKEQQKQNEDLQQTIEDLRKKKDKKDMVESALSNIIAHQSLGIPLRRGSMVLPSVLEEMNATTSEVSDNERLASSHQKIKLALPSENEKMGSIGNDDPHSQLNPSGGITHPTSMPTPAPQAIIPQKSMMANIFGVIPSEDSEEDDYDAIASANNSPTPNRGTSKVPFSDNRPKSVSPPPPSITESKKVDSTIAPPPPPPPSTSFIPLKPTNAGISIRTASPSTTSALTTFASNTLTSPFPTLSTLDDSVVDDEEEVIKITSDRQLYEALGVPLTPTPQGIRRHSGNSTGSSAGVYSGQVSERGTPLLTPRSRRKLAQSGGGGSNSSTPTNVSSNRKTSRVFFPDSDNEQDEEDSGKEEEILRDAIRQLTLQVKSSKLAQEANGNQKNQLSKPLSSKARKSFMLLHPKDANFRRNEEEEEEKKSEAKELLEAQAEEENQTKNKSVPDLIELPDTFVLNASEPKPIEGNGGSGKTNNNIMELRPSRKFSHDLRKSLIMDKDHMSATLLQQQQQEQLQQGSTALSMLFGAPPVEEVKQSHDVHHARDDHRDDPEDDSEYASINMAFFYKKLFEYLGNGTRAGILKAFRIIEISLNANASLNAIAEENQNNNHPHEGQQQGGFSSPLPLRRKSSMVINNYQGGGAGGAANGSGGTVHGGPSMGKRRLSLTANIAPFSSVAIANTFNLIPVQSYYDMKTLFEIIIQRTAESHIRSEIQSLLCHTLHLSNIEDVMAHVRLLYDAFQQFEIHRQELSQPLKVWDITPMFQASKILIYLFGIEDRKGNTGNALSHVPWMTNGTSDDGGSSSMSMLSAEARESYDLLKTLQDSLQHCILYYHVQQSSLKHPYDITAVSQPSTVVSGPLTLHSPVMTKAKSLQTLIASLPPITVSVHSLISDCNSVTAQLMVFLLPRNVALIEIMFRLGLIRDACQATTGYFKSTNKRDIAKFLKRFIAVLDEQLNLDLTVIVTQPPNNLSVGTSSGDNDTTTGSGGGKKKASAADATALSERIRTFMCDLNNVNDSEINASQVETNSFFSAETGRQLMDRAKYIQQKGEDLFQRMKTYRDTVYRHGQPIHQDSDSDDDSDDDEGRRRTSYSGNGIEANSSGKFTRRSISSSGKNNRNISNEKRKEQEEVKSLDNALQKLLLLKDDLKKRLLYISTILLQDEVERFVKESAASNQDEFANTLFEAMFKQNDSSIAVLLIRTQSIALLNSIFRSWPKLTFSVPYYQPVSLMPGMHGHHHSSDASVYSTLSASAARQPPPPPLTPAGPTNVRTSFTEKTPSRQIPPPPGTTPAGMPVVTPRRPSMAGLHPDANGMITPGDHHHHHGPLHSHVHGPQLGSSTQSHHPFANPYQHFGPTQQMIESFKLSPAKEIDLSQVNFKETKTLRKIGFTLMQLRDCKVYSWSQLLAAGYPLNEIKILRSLTATNPNASTLSAYMDDDRSGSSSCGQVGNEDIAFELTVLELRKAGYSIEQCLKAGFDATALKAGGFDELQLVQSGLFTIGQLKKAGCDVQRFALRALFESTNGKYWKKKDNWCTTKPLGDWYGVKVDGKGNVIRIDLRNNELEGKAYIYYCPLDSSLMQWYLGALPEALCLLTQLEYLDLYNNHLTGEVPTSYGKLLCLKDLWLDNNHITNKKAHLQTILPHCRIRL